MLTIASNNPLVSVFGTRHSAIDFREQIEERLELCDLVKIDFSGMFVTQSFVDELLGPLILRMGPAALQRLAFTGCNQETRAVLQLVFAARLEDFAARQASPQHASFA